MSLFSSFKKLLFVGSLLSTISPVYGNEPTNTCTAAFKGLTEEMETTPFFKEILSQIDGLDFEINISEIDEDTKEKISEYVTILNEMSKESSSCSADIKKDAQKILEQLLRWQIVIDEAASEQEPQSSYLGLKIAAGVLTVVVVPGLYFLPKYMANDQAGNRIARMYFRIFQLLRIATVAPQVIFAGGGGGTEYVEVEVQGPTRNVATKYSIFNEACRLLNKHFKGGYGVAPFSSANHLDVMSDRYGIEKQENIVIVADYIFEHPNQGNAFYMNYISRMFKK